VSPRSRAQPAGENKIKEYRRLAVHSLKCKVDGCGRYGGRCGPMKTKLVRLKQHWECCGVPRTCRLCRTYRHVTRVALRSVRAKTNQSEETKAFIQEQLESLMVHGSPPLAPLDGSESRHLYALARSHEGHGGFGTSPDGFK